MSALYFTVSIAIIISNLATAQSETQRKGGGEVWFIQGYELIHMIQLIVYESFFTILLFCKILQNLILTVFNVSTVQDPTWHQKGQQLEQEVCVPSFRVHSQFFFTWSAAALWQKT